eukprot:1963861-Prymnesium_polylepis.1
MRPTRPMHLHLRSPVGCPSPHSVLRALCLASRLGRLARGPRGRGPVDGRGRGTVGTCCTRTRDGIRHGH